MYFRDDSGRLTDRDVDTMAISGSESYWQLQKWNLKAMEVRGTVARWIWWNLRRI